MVTKSHAIDHAWAGVIEGLLSFGRHVWLSGE